MILEKIIPYNVHISHKQHSPKVWLETEHFANLSFLGPGLRVPAITYGPRTDPRETLSCIIEIFKVVLEFNRSDE